MLVDHILPKRLRTYIEESVIPEQEEVETSMDNINDLKNSDDQFFNSYNNLLFLQKSEKKERLRTKSNPRN